MDEKYPFSGEEEYSEGATQAENTFTDITTDSDRAAYRSGGKAGVFERYNDPSRQFTGTRSYHQDHSSVGGLTAEEINKAREAKRSVSKPHKQMVKKCTLYGVNDTTLHFH